MSAATHIDTAAPHLVDLRPMIPTERHATVFAMLETLDPGESFVLINDHAPIPLLRRIEDHWPGLFTPDVLRDGPDVWQAAITRVSD